MEENNEVSVVEDQLEEGVKTPTRDYVEVFEVEKSDGPAETPAKSDKALAAHPAGKKQQGKSVATALPRDTFVSLKALVYLAVAQNSRSVAAVQTRLLELGFIEAGGEKQGWFGPSTFAALRAFQNSAAVDEEYAAGEQTIHALFAGTHVEVIE